MSRLQSPLLLRIKNSSRTKVKTPVILRFDKDMLGKWQEKLNDTKKMFPSWYYEHVDKSNKVSPMRGQAIFDELNNMEDIIEDYMSSLTDQMFYDKQRNERTVGRKPDCSNTHFSVIFKTP